MIIMFFESIVAGYKSGILILFEGLLGLLHKHVVKAHQLIAIARFFLSTL